MKFEHTEVWGFEHAIRGMRNPLGSWDKSDSDWEFVEDPSVINPNDQVKFVMGENDLKLAQKLIKAGSEHRKFMRQILICVDITAPLYWWKEFDTYKVGTVANSCSTMHKISAKKFEPEDFSYEHIFIFKDENSKERDYTATNAFTVVVDALNHFRDLYVETKDKDYWWQMIQLLPTSYNQRRTVTMNYENVVSMIKQRTGHKLDEWNEFVRILRDLPYVKEIIDD